MANARARPKARRTARRKSTAAPVGRVRIRMYRQGIGDCFLLTFRSAADRDAYLVAPAHKEFGAIAGPYLDREKLCVVDYWTKR